MTVKSSQNEIDTIHADRRVWRIGLLALAVAIRGGLLWGETDRLQADPDSYRQLALAVQDHGVFGYPAGPTDSSEGQTIRPTAYRPPLYPLVLTMVGWGTHVSPGSVAILHLLLGVATVDLIYVLGRRWASETSGLLAAVLVAADPILLSQSVLVMTETLATFLAVVGLCFLGRLGRDDARNGTGDPLSAGLAGGTLALATLCRPTFLLGLAAVWIVLLCRAWSRQRRLWEPAAFLVLPLLVLLPWALRNQACLGRPVLTTTHGGYTLWLANNEDYYQFLATSRWGDVWDSRDLDRAYSQVREELHDELQADRWARLQAWATIRRHPGTFASACLVRLGSLWGLIPHQVADHESSARRWLRYAVGIWYAGVFLLAVAGLWTLGRQAWRPPWLWGLLLVAAFSAAHTVYWTNLRMRAPLMPVVCLLAAVATVAEITSRFPARAKGAAPGTNRVARMAKPGHG
ncbi:MAG: glycosyltransferase family 39 protein [Planctomycetota bacterium]|nr:glycosyltransferase family 39 protein [Planctomycetota bacterium]